MKLSLLLSFSFCFEVMGFLLDREVIRSVLAVERLKRDDSW